ncbi:hypothetical protein ACGFWE_25090 [Streptomyces sp. NPDC048523]|uniref:hypothetical protein n=1 Tax=Streptomyces sp. NPDC048523 TaxID=3365567 RepID=UPI0037247D55
MLLVRGQVAAGGDDLVDRVEDIGAQDGVRSGELGVQVVDRAGGLPRRSAAAQ